jgi:hypothetical protein
MSDLEEGPDPSRRGALRKMALRTGALTELPILGQGAVTTPKPHSVHACSPSSLQPDPNWKPVFFDEHLLPSRTSNLLTGVL